MEFLIGLKAVDILEGLGVAWSCLEGNTLAGCKLFLGGMKIKFEPTG